MTTSLTALPNLRRERATSREQGHSAVENRSYFLALHRVARRTVRSLKPFVELGEVHSMRDLGLLHRHINVGDLERARHAPLILLEGLHPPRDRLVQGVGVTSTVTYRREYVECVKRCGTTRHHPLLPSPRLRRKQDRGKSFEALKSVR
jgi:hypothetical protein